MEHDPPVDGVTDNTQARRFELHTDDGTAFLDYVRRGDALVLTHTEVPPAQRGRGIGSRLVEGALDLARAAGLRVVPRCAFVRAWLRRHPDRADSIGD